MKMCPDVLLPALGGASRSAAEEKIFRRLKGVNLGPHWRAYHSLNCSEHRYKQWAELDFVIIGPEGALVIEGKGGQVRRENGVWIYTDRFGREHKNTEGPFNQAKSAMYALKEMLAEKYELEPVVSDRLVFGWGVVFPDMNWDIDTPETPAKLVGDRIQVKDPSSLERYFRKILEYWRAKARHDGVVSREELERIHCKLRPDIHVFPPLSFKIGETLNELQELTTEQYELYDMFAENKRLLVNGASGTGKTYLMLQCAREEVARGGTVLVVVESLVLASWLKVLESDPAIQIRAYSDLSDPPEPVDVLFVDEGQDLMTEQAFDTLDKYVKSGLEEGYWRWFMDDVEQSGVSGEFDQGAYEYLTEVLNPVRVNLKYNVRNTQEVAAAVRSWTGSDIGISKKDGFGEEPELIQVEDPEDLLEKLGEKIGEVINGGANAGDIGIVLPKGLDGIFLRNLPRRDSDKLGLPRTYSSRLIPLDSMTVSANLKGKIIWGGVDVFKGLERPIMMCVGFDDEKYATERVAELYVATTRANYGLFLFAGPGLFDELQKRNSVGDV